MENTEQHHSTIQRQRVFHSALPEQDETGSSDKKPSVGLGVPSDSPSDCKSRISNNDLGFRVVQRPEEKAIGAHLPEWNGIGIACSVEWLRNPMLTSDLPY